MKKRLKRYIPLVVVAALLVLTFTMCTGRSDEPYEPYEPYEPEPPVEIQEPEEPEPYEPEPEPYEPEPEPEPPHDGPVNPLTGLPVEEDISMMRPVAIVINNLRLAQPTLGISKADIIYEVPVEGGITRLLAVFQDVSDVGPIGTVRSARPYHVDLAQAHDAIFIFAGGSPEAYTTLSNRNITRLDGVNGRLTHIFYRCQQRRRSMGLEHSMLTSGELITQWLPTYNNFRLEHNEGFEHPKTFYDDGTPLNGSPAENFTVRFSTGKTTSFVFNEETRLYYVSQHGGEYRDGNDDTHVSVANVLVLQTAVSVIDNAGRLRITLTGSGVGYFFSGGQYVEINWSRENASAPFVYTLNDGTELTFGRGRTYVCIIPTRYGFVIN